jgi:dTMP kinase
MQGRLIVFDGGEGGGKTTQLQRSLHWLKDSGWVDLLQAHGHIQKLVATREPGGTDLGREIRSLLLGQSPQASIYDRVELLLYAADRAQHVEGFLKPQLAEGALILCDRYTSSTIAYQGHGRGLDLPLIEQLNQIATHGLQSDLTLWLDLDVDTGLERMRQRGNADRIEQADRNFHQRVRQGFAELAISHRDRFVRIDASQSEDTVANQIQIVLSTWLTNWYGVTI